MEDVEEEEKERKCSFWKVLSKIYLIYFKKLFPNIKTHFKRYFMNSRKVFFLRKFHFEIHFINFKNCFGNHILETSFQKFYFKNSVVKTFFREFWKFYSVKLSKFILESLWFLSISNFFAFFPFLPMYPRSIFALGQTNCNFRTVSTCTTSTPFFFLLFLFELFNHKQKIFLNYVI